MTSPNQDMPPKDLQAAALFLLTALASVQAAKLLLFVMADAATMLSSFRDGPNGDFVPIFLRSPLFPIAVTARAVLAIGLLQLAIQMACQGAQTLRGEETIATLLWYRVNFSRVNALVAGFALLGAATLSLSSGVVHGVAILKAVSFELQGVDINADYATYVGSLALSLLCVLTCFSLEARRKEWSEALSQRGFPTWMCVGDDFWGTARPLQDGDTEHASCVREASGAYQELIETEVPS